MRSASEVSHQIGPTLAPLASASSGIDAPVEGHEIPGSAHAHRLLGHRIIAHAEQRLRALLLRGAVVVEAHEQQRAVAAHREERARPGGILERTSRSFDFAHELAGPGVDDRDALCRIEVVDQQESIVVRQHGVAHHRHAGGALGRYGNFADGGERGGIVQGDDVGALAARSAREIGFRGIDELAVAGQQQVLETVARAQRAQVTPGVAVDQIRHAVGHVRKHEVVDPHPVLRCRDGESRGLHAVRGVRRQLRLRGAGEQRADQQ